MRILFAEDEKDLNRIIKRKLKDEGYSVDACLNGEEALFMLKVTEYDACILDIMMPRMNGLQVLERMRMDGIMTPVLFLTARDSIEDKVTGLDLGANDYLVKPFSMQELMARVRAMLRASHAGGSAVMTIDDLEIDTARRSVRRSGQVIDLSQKEYALLEYLAVNRNIVMSRDQIEEHIWDMDYEGGTNVVDVYISYLRRKIDDGHENKLITTVRGRGYCLKG